MGFGSLVVPEENWTKANAEASCQALGAGIPDPDPGRSSGAEDKRLAAGTATRSEIVTKRTGMGYRNFLLLKKQDEEMEMEVLGRTLDDSEVSNENEENENG